MYVFYNVTVTINVTVFVSCILENLLKIVRARITTIAKTF